MESTGDLGAAGERLVLELEPKGGTELCSEMPGWGRVAGQGGEGGAHSRRVGRWGPGEGWMVKDLGRAWRFPNGQRTSSPSPTPLVPAWSPGEGESLMRIGYLLLYKKERKKET